MSSKGGSAPAAPNPQAEANAQMQVNQSAINQMAVANRSNVNGPDQNTTWVQDPTTGQWTQTTTLNPQLQANLNQQNWNQGALQNIAGGALTNLANNGTIGGSLNTSGVNPLTSSVAKTPLITGINTNNLPGIQTGLNTNFAGQQQQAQNAAYQEQAQYLNPQWQQADTALQSQLADQGIMPGSAAYNTAMNNEALQKQQAYSNAQLQAVQAGNTEQNQLFGQSATAGQFANTAAGQAFAQALSQAGLTNSALGQEFGQGVTNAQIGNSANAQGMSNAEAIGNYGLGQVMSILTGAMPNQGTNPGTGATITPAGSPDMGNLYGQQYQGQLNAYNTQTGASNNALSALGNIGAAFVGK
jgi:hypothetical protein